MSALKEECGVFCIQNHPQATAKCTLALHALQHRGQEAVGIVSLTASGEFLSHRAFGYVVDNSTKLTQLPGLCAIGHVKYSTSSKQRDLSNVQPIQQGDIAIAHNGNIVNAHILREMLVHQGCEFKGATDTEVLLHLITLSKKTDVLDKIITALQQVRGAYSLLVMTKNSLLGIRDVYGIRPLVLGKINDSHVLASETCALDIIGAEFIREIAPGEMIMLKKDNTIASYFPFKIPQSRYCVFEYIYFSRADSLCNDQTIYDIRKEIGKELFREYAVKGDVVVPVPDSSIPAALGYAQISNIPFEFGIIRNQYIGRTFIQPTQDMRDLSIRLKHNINRTVITNKRVVLIDDSLVRGTTSRKIITMLRQAGAKEIHLCICSPPIRYSCFYGIDTPKQSELLATKHSIQEMQHVIGVDTLRFLSLTGLYRAIKNAGIASPKHCDACLTGDYPISINN